MPNVSALALSDASRGQELLGKDQDLKKMKGAIRRMKQEHAREVEDFELRLQQESFYAKTLDRR